MPSWGTAPRRPFTDCYCVARLLQPQMDANRRRHVRYPANQAVQVLAFRGDIQEHESARMVNVSQTGICYVGRRYLPNGTRVEIQFEDCLITGEVKNCRLREYASQIEFVTGVHVDNILQGSETWKDLTQS
jgi:PilZ domain-containing protein